MEEKTTTVNKQAATTPASSEKKDDGRGQAPFSNKGARPIRRDQRRRTQRRGRERFKPEFDQKILGIRRVTRVMAGGRRFSFSVTLVCGDRKGRVGVGLGKGGDTAVAIEKAFNSAKKNMVKLSLTEDMSLPHQVEAKFCASRVAIMPAPGKGLVAGSAVRSVLDLAGVKDVSSKILSRSKNPLNNARATMLALSKVSSRVGKKEKSSLHEPKEGTKETATKKTAKV